MNKAQIGRTLDYLAASRRGRSRDAVGTTRNGISKCNTAIKLLREAIEFFQRSDKLERSAYEDNRAGAEIEFDNGVYAMEQAVRAATP